MRLKNMEIDNDYDSALNADIYVIVQKVCELLPRSFDYNEIHYQKVLARELSKDIRFGSFQISTEVNIPYCLDDEPPARTGYTPIFWQSAVKFREIPLVFR